MTTCLERHVTTRPRGKRGRVAALLGGLARAALALLCVAGPAAAQTVSLPNGAVIANTAELRFVRGSVTVIRSSNEARATRVPARTPSTLTLERSAGTDPGVPALAPTRCDRGGVLEPLPPPAASTLLAETGIFHGGEVVFLRVTDRDQDRDATLPDTLRVRVESATTGDAEVLQLTETGNSTGEFVGYVPSEARAAAPSDCALQVARDGELRGAYVDAQDAADQAEDRALVDPVGLVFDAVTGNPVSGARVRIVDAATGQPAQVLGDDGVSAFPAEVVTGQQAVDAGGTLYLFAPGAFRFPVLAQPGDYRVQVVPPAGHAFPSARAEADLQALPGAPWRLNAGSFGLPYAVPAPPAANIDIPLDPVSAELALEKTSSTPLASAGDFVQYRLTLTARDANGAVADATIDDLLPPGFRYVRGSARVDGERADDPQIATDGRHLTFAVGALAAAQRLELRYVTEVTPLASGSEARNVARARGGGGLVSNEAVAVVRLREDLFRTRATLVGRIGHGSCESAAQAAEGVRVYLEDGRYSVTDREGRYHFEALQPGTHVVQVDAVTLPAGSQVAACAGVNRTGGNGRSQFVELRAGSLWRADFVLTGAPPAANSRAADEAARPKPAAAAWPEVESLQPGIAFVWPAADAAPAMPSIKVAVQHASRQQVELTVNGQSVGKLAFDGTSQNAARDIALSKWRGVDIREGDNELVAIVRDAAGTEVARVARVVHFSTGAVRAEFVPAASRLIADGRQRPQIAVRLTDRQGRPVRPNLQGTFQVLAPHRAWASVEALDDNALIATGNREPTWVVGADGIVQLELEPTTTAGWATVRVALGRGQSREIRAWLEPAARDWILVALAEGTAAYQTVSAHSTPTDVDEGLAEDGRVAFFAKGTIRGEYLLTVAYDSAKALGATTRLKGEIDPDAVYTLYGDATETRYDAESQRNLYLKLERREFVALFGDFDTPFATVELARYARTFNGFRADYAGAGAQAAVFAADTRQQQQRDDLQGDGTSGPYRLSRRPLVANSDKVRIEVRDRFRSDRIVTTRELVRHLDYSIDFETGVILLREPLASRDPDFNPAFLVAEYEVLARAADEATTAGLRATTQLADGRIEAGVSYISEGAADGRAALAGIDLRTRLSPQSELRAEAAQTDQDGAGGHGAWLVEFTHASESVEVRAYGREQQQAFGLGQQFAPDAGTRRLGVETRLHLSRALVSEIDIGHLQQLDDGSSRAEAAAELRYDLDGRTLGVGLRGVEDAVGDERQTSALATLSGSQEFLAGRARVRGRLETSLAGPAESTDYPERAVLGLDYQVAPGTQLFSEYEHAIGDGASGDTTRMGVRSQPWARATLTSGLQQQTSEAGSRLYANLGLTQGWQATEQLSLDFGLDQGKALQDASDRPIQPDYPPASGADEDFVSGFAGAAWRAGPWMATARAELRDADSERRSVFSAGAYRELGSGRALSGALRQVDSRGADSRTRLTDLTLGWAHRPLDGRWMALDQADIIAESRDAAAGDERSWRLVNNLNVNVALDLQTQLSLQFGARYGESTFDGSHYSGFTGLYGAELRHALRGPWDLGGGATLMQATRSGTAEWSAGLDVGYEFARHAWISVGYNVKGFEDADFSGGRHTAQGPFIKLRVKADQGLLQGLGIESR